MFDTFREPHFFTFSVIFSHIASIFTFIVDLFSHLATFSHIAAFSHLRVPHTCSRVCPHLITFSLSLPDLTICVLFILHRSFAFASTLLCKDV